MMVKSTCTGNDFFCLSEFQTYKPTTPEYARLTTLLATITAQSFPTGTTPHTYDADKVATLNQAIIASQAATIDYPAATLNTLYNNLTTAYNDVLASLVRFDGYYYIVNKDLSNEKAIYSDLGLTLKWNSLQSDDAKFVFHITPLPSGNYSIQNLYNEAYVGTVNDQSTAFPLTETLETEQTFTRLSEGVWRIASSTYNIGYHTQDWGGGVGGNVIAWELTTEYGSLGTYPYSKWELRAVSDADLANIIAKRDAERSTGCLALVFIGNSITQGVGVSNATTEAAPIVTGRLIETYSGKNVAIRNCGHSGSTTLDWMPGTTYYNEAIAAAEAIKRYGSLWFSIMLGTNDSAENGPNGSPVSTDNYKANLKSIIDALLTKYEDAKVVINYPIWYSDNTHNGAVYKAEGLARLQSYHPIITTLVAEYQAAGKAVYAGSTKAYSYFEGNTSLYSAENGNSGTFYLHPNTQGATKLAQFWAGSILGHNIATATGTAIELSMNGSVDANTLKAAIEAATNEATTAVDLSGLTLGSDVEAIDIEQEGNTLVYLASTSSVTGKNIVVGTTCSNLVLTDGHSFAAPRGFTATTASYNRIMSGEWGTVCLPFAVTSDDNIEYYTITGITGSDDNKAIVVEKVEGVLAAGTPALVRKVNGEGLAVSVSNVAVDGLIKDVNSTVNMIGSFTYDNKILKENHPNAYYIKNDKFYHIKNNFYCDAFRAYFEDASPNPSGAFSIIINDDLTAMKPTVTGDSTEIVAIYGADGTKRAAMQKGMNIVKLSNGETQKIMVN
jgi:lysophospholipase L1-like esterase